MEYGYPTTATRFDFFSRPNHAAVGFITKYKLCLTDKHNGISHVKRTSEYSV